MRGVPWKRWIVVLLALAVVVALVVRRSGCSHRQQRPRAHSAERAPVKKVIGFEYTEAFETTVQEIL